MAGEWWSFIKQPALLYVLKVRIVHSGVWEEPSRKLLLFILMGRKRKKQEENGEIWVWAYPLSYMKSSFRVFAVSSPTNTDGITNCFMISTKTKQTKWISYIHLELLSYFQLQLLKLLSEHSKCFFTASLIHPFTHIHAWAFCTKILRQAGWRSQGLNHWPSDWKTTSPISQILYTWAFANIDASF